jgi:hypothetical protein
LLTQNYNKERGQFISINDGKIHYFKMGIAKNSEERKVSGK